MYVIALLTILWRLKYIFMKEGLAHQTKEGLGLLQLEVSWCEILMFSIRSRVAID